MQFDFKEFKDFVTSFKEGPIGVPFLDGRIKDMRNPQGYVAGYYRLFYELTKKYKPEVVVELGS